MAEHDPRGDVELETTVRREGVPPPMEPASRAPEAPPPSPLQPGQELLGRYTVLSQLGEGGMGVVLSAYDAKLDRRVALKLMGTRAARQQREAEQLRLMREAQAMAR
ncbi:MAG TPA: serine/threonine protein kinase, partial [Myxococcus sp.]|nr:serine/threonine protein kinase [Myxococcus sp.]